MTRRPILAAALAAAALACAGGQRGRAPETVVRTIPLPEHGALELRVPKDWALEESAPDEPVAMGIRVTPKDHRFVALLTPYWDPDAPQAPAEAETAQTAAELARRKAREGSVEKEIALQELVGDGVHGYWFTATDKDLANRKPGKDEWRALMQGAAAVGRIVLIFEMLDNGPGPQRQQILEMIRHARHVPAADEGAPPAGPAKPGADGGGGGPGEPGGGGDREGLAPDAFRPDPSIETVPLSLELPGRAWSALVDLPGFEAMPPRTSQDGKSALVLARDPKTGFVASVLLTDAAGATTAAACRARDLEKIERVLPDLRDLRTSEAGDVARAEYVAPTLHGEPIAQWNAHAWRARDGVCVHLHLSKMNHDAADHAAAEKALRTLRFGEPL